jgi:ABC-type nickel/cobalt efflux system permease component RcnA
VRVDGGITFSIGALSITAAGLGFVHTLLGPDHYLPFVAMSRAGGWSLTRTAVITLACGAGHVLSSVVLGLIGVALGIGVFKLQAIEAARGELAGWLLLAFGLAYFVWGVRRAIRNRPHSHVHVHGNGTVHLHEHSHVHSHTHVHAPPHVPAAAASTESNPGRRLTPWVLFLIFVFGPCEPLIPLLMYPAATNSIWGLVLVTLVFGVTTLATMTIVVLLACSGATKFTFGRFERYSHATAGLLVVVCGTAILLGR